MFWVASITKSAIGLCYVQAGVDLTLPLVEGIELSDTPNNFAYCRRLTLVQCLCHYTGAENDHDNFDFDQYRDWVTKPGATGRCLDLMETLVRKSNPSCEPKFAYNNIVWHLLTWRLHSLTGRTCTEFLSELFGGHVSGNSRGGITQGRDWGWETDADGIPLGPHGLKLNYKAAHVLGEIGRYVMDSICYPTTRLPTPRTFWEWLELPAPISIWLGWWFCKDTVFAHGFCCQFVAATRVSTYVQLSEDFGEPTQKKRLFLANSIM